MIDKTQLIEKLGKQKATEFMVNSRSNEPTGHDRTRGIKGRVRWRMCEHGRWTIEDYKAKACPKCHSYKATKPRDFKPYFNIGLGAFVESRSEEKSLAKAKGYIEAG